ncbi:MAG TPA: hypothetical protein ENJ09_09815 [Planctomycetes bacterium]|nr:hypothetical protein [Planctomycetota bacterium]
MRSVRTQRALVGLVTLAAAFVAPGRAHACRSVQGSEAGLAIRVGKLLTMDDADRVFDPGMILVEAGRITYVGEPIEVPDSFRRIDEPRLWAFPGLVDLHTHIHATGWFDLNDMVVPLSQDLRATPAFEPHEPRLAYALAAGVTSLFGIPGSGTSIGGFGLFYKSKSSGTFEDVVFKDPGGMKSAFNFNPQRSRDLGASWAGLTWNVQHLCDALVARADLDSTGNHADPADWETENLERVLAGDLPVLVHCASAEGVAGVVRMWRLRYDTAAVVSHGSWDGHLAAAFCAATDTPVNHGPRVLNFTSMRREGRVQGGAEAFLAAGVPNFSLNTDSPIVPEEELFLQGSMSARLGADAYAMLQALTSHPADSFLVGDRIGSLEVGKDADIVLSTGDPLDPRSRVEFVFIDGEVQYSARDDGQLF